MFFGIFDFLLNLFVNVMEAIHSRYLIVNEQDLLWGLTINSIGRQTVKPDVSYPLSNHPTRYLFSTEKGRVLNEYQLLYIVQGTGVFESASCNPVQVKAGNMFLLFPNEWHNYHPHKKTGWDEYWIGFTGANIDVRVENGFFSKQKPVFFVGILEEIVHLFNQGIIIAKEQKAGYQQMLAGIVNHLLGIAYSVDKHMNFEDLNVANQINKSKIIFTQRFQEEIKIEKIASELNMSYSWFRRLFKEYTGFAPAQYVQELRIQHAKELLTNTTLSTKEISFLSGFDNSEYFFTAFKNKTGYTPLKYRAFSQQKNI